MRFLDALEAGNAVPEVLTNRFDAGELGLIQLINGRPQEVEVDGKQQPL